jgi:two-component system chemotaxis response regulator CheY
MKVLIVDDSLTLRRLCAKVVHIGYPDAEIIEASDGVDAKYRIKEVDLILLDWNMPIMNGHDFLVWLRTVKKSTIPVIMVTAEAGKESVLKAIQAGATQYVVKPFSVESLLEKIRKCLGNPEQEEVPEEQEEN